MSKVFPPITNRNSTIDVLRLLAAFLVVFIHSGVHSLDGKVGFLGTILLVFGRLAVPFFFVVSGYFLYSNYDKQVSRVAKSVPKLLNIFILSSLLYFIFFGWYFGSYSFTASLITPSTIFNMIAFNHPIYNEALWFLLALICGSLVVLLNAKYVKKDWLLMILASFFYVASLLVSNYSQFINIEQVNVSYYRNFLGEGLLFIMIGYMCSKYASRLQAISYIKLFSYSMLCLALYFIEFYAVRTNVESPADIYIMFPILSVLIITWSIKYPNVLSKTVVPMLGAQIALYIYILHILFLYSIEILYARLGIDGGQSIAAIVRLLVAFLLSLGLGYLYYVGKKRISNKLKK